MTPPTSSESGPLCGLWVGLRVAAGRIKRLPGRCEPPGGSTEVLVRGCRLVCAVTSDLFERGAPGGESHDYVGEVLGSLGPLVGALGVASPGGGNRRWDSEGDPASRTGLDRPAHRGLRLFKCGEGVVRVPGGRDQGSVDAVEEVEADGRLAGDRKGLVQ